MNSSLSLTVCSLCSKCRVHINSGLQFFCITFTGQRLSTSRHCSPLVDQHSTPCGESFFEGERSVSAISCRSANKENILVTSETNTNPAGLANGNSTAAQNLTASSISSPSASKADHTSKDSLLLTELLESSDDEWANTCILDTNYGQKESVSSTSTSTTLCSGSRINSVASTPFNQRATTNMSFQDKSANVQNNFSNNFNSSFNYSPQRANTIPNNGNDSKLFG